VPRAQWKPDWWRLYHQGAEVTHDLMQLIHLHQPPPLHWDPAIHTRLSFANLGDRGHVLRLKWIWGRTSWQNTAPFWEYNVDNPPACHACAGNHQLDLFSCLASCPSWQNLRTVIFSWWQPYAHLIEAWFNQAGDGCRRSFCRSLVPTSLVQHLVAHQLSMQRITTLVRTRDKQWEQGISHLRNLYTQQHFPLSPPNDLMPG
jgi:hypothetical protein